MTDPTHAMPAVPPPPPPVGGDLEVEEPKPNWWQRRMPVWAVIAIGLTCLVAGAATASGEADDGDEEVATADDAAAESAAALEEVDALTADVDELEEKLAERNDDVGSLQAALEKKNEPTTTTAPTTTTTTAPPVTEPPTTQAPPPPAGSISQDNARSSAADYLEFTAFSRTGLIGQLEYEGFSTEDATAAVDSLNVDWNEQAAKSAADYLSFTSFSRSGLIDQLMYEGFSQAEAEYGVSTTGL